MAGFLQVPPHRQQRCHPIPDRRPQLLGGALPQIAGCEHPPDRGPEHAVGGDEADILSGHGLLRKLGVGIKADEDERRSRIPSELLATLYLEGHHALQPALPCSSSTSVLLWIENCGSSRTDQRGPFTPAEAARRTGVPAGPDRCRPS